MTPVILTIAHAGRDYAQVMPAARVPEVALRALEDRYVDRLTDIAGAEGHAIVAFAHPRAYIDVNREPADLDSAMVANTPARILSPRARGGLGLVPRRLGGWGELWRRPLTRPELDARLFAYRDFHDRVTAAVDDAVARWGAAVLLDIHSMPPLPQPVDVVIGDLHGRAADSDIFAQVEAGLITDGLRVARNTPYAGGAILARHGRPRRNVHAIQLEIDRQLYLDVALERPSDAVPRLSRLLASIANTLALRFHPLAHAAE